MSVLKEIAEYSWFLPKSTLVQQEIGKMVEQHQQRLQPFGLKSVLPVQIVKIWPGSSPRELEEMYRASRQSIYHMIIENLMGVIRDIAVDSARMPLLNDSMREMSSQVKSSAKEAAIQVAGLTVKATLTMQAVALDSESNGDLSDFDTVDKAVDDAVESMGWYIAWMVTEDYFKQKNYDNPFEPIGNLWKLGLWPMGVYKNNYIILVPGGRRVRIVTPSIR